MKMASDTMMLTPDVPLDEVDFYLETLTKKGVRRWSPGKYGDSEGAQGQFLAFLARGLVSPRNPGVPRAKTLAASTSHTGGAAPKTPVFPRKNAVIVE
jgi:hypothetical protein